MVPLKADPSSTCRDVRLLSPYYVRRACYSSSFTRDTTQESRLLLANPQCLAIAPRPASPTNSINATDIHPTSPPKARAQSDPTPRRN
jgi:hypothetical protein